MVAETLFSIHHHGAVRGVTGSCHELKLASGSGVLIDCGLFQGAETSGEGATSARLEIDFPIAHIGALVLTHVHLDHAGRVPYLMSAGFDGPIFCSEPSAHLLPLMLEDALRVGASRDPALVQNFLKVLERRLAPLAYGVWTPLPLSGDVECRVRLHPAGHILGSAYLEFRVSQGGRRETVIFSGDLGAPYAPLLPSPKSPYGADVVVLESTYGDRNHENRKNRRLTLRNVIERALVDAGTVLIPAFSIGRTQELLYELEDIIHRHPQRAAAPNLPWPDLEIIVDSPLASRFTEVFNRLRPYWDKEAKRLVARGRHPLSFEQMTTIDSHDDHMRAVQYLARTAKPAVVIAGSGMCTGGRVVNYLKAMLGDERHNVLFVGYQAQGTPGYDIQSYGPRGGFVVLDDERYPIRAKVHTISGYSAHAGQGDLVNFVKRMRRYPREVRLIHGDDNAKRMLKSRLDALNTGAQIVIP